MKYEKSSGCGTNCCDPCGTVELEGCAAGVPFLQLVSISTGSATTRWLNLNTGSVETVMPTGFATGTCSEVGDNQKTCYEFGTDSYTQFVANGTKTYLKNGTVLTAQADIDAAIAIIATATYANIVDCTPAVTPAVTCRGAHYEQLTLVPGVAQTITHTFAMTNALAIGYSVRGVDGGTVGDWPTGVRFINHTADTVDIIADGIGGVVDVALFNTECLSEVVTEGTTSGGGGGGTDSQTLSTSGTNLAISGGNSVNLSTAIKAGETVTTMTNVLTSGTKIATYTNEAGTVVDIYAPTGGSTADTTAVVTSTDGSVTVTSSTAGNITTYNLSAATNKGTAGAGGQSYLGNTVGQTTNQSIPSTMAAVTTVLLPATVTNSFVNGTTYNAATGILTIGETGNYYVSYAVRYGAVANFPVTAASWYLAGVQVNGATISTMSVDVEVTATKASLQIPNASLIVALNAGDQVKLITQHSESSAKPVYGSRGTFLNVARMSGV